MICQNVTLQQIHLNLFRHRLGKTHADTDKAHRLSRAAECFCKQRTKISQCEAHDQRARRSSA